MGSGLGALFGTRVHVDFAKRVEQLDLPGIGVEGVEQSFHIRQPRIGWEHKNRHRVEGPEESRPAPRLPYMTLRPEAPF